tara:strand:- start:38958 stop:39794 length:837 start_codon:yes stop_codon:yes gene_type:complete
VHTPIISVQALAALLDSPTPRSPTLRIVDVRPEPGARDDGFAQYQRGHIPGAIHLGLERGLSGPSGPGRHPLPTPQAFAQTLASAGIDDACDVVCYDQGNGAYAARLWWMLDNLGLDSVTVLDGGLDAWQEAGHALQTTTPTYPKATWERLESRNATYSKEELAADLSAFHILDARAAERYRGDVEPIDAVAGHIPTALSAPFADNLVDGRFRSKEELLARFSELAISDGKPIVHSCGSGVTACHNILAMRIAGLGRTALYPGSWSDWSSSGYPVETG